MVAAILGASALLGERHRQRATAEPFESGTVPVGDARVRFPAKFYLVAAFFVIFDLEAVYLFAWALAARESGWPGFIEAAVFIAILAAGLAYLWRAGAFDWGSRRWRTRH